MCICMDSSAPLVRLRLRVRVCRCSSVRVCNYLCLCLWLSLYVYVCPCVLAVELPVCACLCGPTLKHQIVHTAPEMVYIAVQTDGKPKKVAVLKHEDSRHYIAIGNG